MIEDLQLRGYSDSTQDLYVRAVRKLCEHYNKCPGQITEEELRDYFLYGKNVKKWARSTSTVALCGIKFFYENTIQRPWPTLLFIRPGREKKLPVVLSRDEVHEILSNIELLRYRTCLTTIYSCGLRLSEGIHLKVENIDSARGFIQVRNSKGHMGDKDRDVPLPQKTLVLLREQWKSHKNKVWLFPSAGRSGKDMPFATRPISKSSVQTAFRKALKTAGINKKATVHSLRIHGQRIFWKPASTCD
jgi:integrase